MKRYLKVAEILCLYIGTPVILGLLDAPRRVLYSFLLGAAFLCVIYLARQKNFSWRRFFLGYGWPAEQRRAAFWRFCLCVPLLAMATGALVPERFMSFPLERPRMWMLVMLLYPVLSVVPQVIVFRAFFFTRYGGLFPPAALLVANGLCFGVAHAMYGNWIAPVFSTVGGILFAYSFRQHRSLLWGTVEQSAYGCLIFTLGIGWYFFKHAP